MACAVLVFSYQPLYQLNTCTAIIQVMISHNIWRQGMFWPEATKAPKILNIMICHKSSSQCCIIISTPHFGSGSYWVPTVFFQHLGSLTVGLWNENLLKICRATPAAWLGFGCAGAQPQVTPNSLDRFRLLLQRHMNYLMLIVNFQYVNVSPHRQLRWSD